MGSTKIDDTDVGFYNNTGAAIRSIQDIKSLVKQGGANTTAFASNPEARSMLHQSIGELVRAYNKVVDPNSAVLLTEIEALTDSMLGNPDTTRTNLFLRRIEGMQDKVIGRSADYSTIRPQVPVNPAVRAAYEASQNGTPTGNPPAVAPEVHAEAVRWAKNEGRLQAPEKAAAILRAHGLE